jgi:hypothetical protein
MGTTIPGSLGLPFLGETLSLLTDPLNYFNTHRQRYGTVFQIIIPISHTHRSPEYFARPEHFLPPREEEKKTSYAWMAFGGGKHMCLGMGDRPDRDQDSLNPTVTPV